MKFLSWILIVLLMSWTFQASKTSQALPVAQHGYLVEELKTMIVDYLVNNVENVQNIDFQRFFTEIVVPQENIPAYVKYSYESTTESGALTREVREGEFDLFSTDGGQTWEPNAKNFRGLNLEFLEGLRVTPGEPDELPALEDASITE